MASFNVQKITTTNKTLVDFPGNNHSSMILSNSHASASITIDLYVTSQFGTAANGYITSTGTDIDYVAGYTATSSSLAVVLSATAATSDAFLDERVYKSDGKLIGTCTTFTDGTHITFGGGIVRPIADAVVLHTGTRYYLFKDLKIPRGVSLKLDPNEFSFNTNYYKMYINSDNSDGGIDIITRY